MKKTGYPLAYDIGGVLLITVATILLLSLISYNPLDNSVQFHGENSIRNWIGPGGALTSYIAFTILGLMAYALPISFFYFGLSFLWRQPFWRSPVRGIGALILLLSLAVLLESAEILRHFFSFMPGGLLGHLILDAVTKHFSTLGTLVWSLCFLAIGLILFTGAGIIENLALSLKFPLRMKELGLNLFKRSPSKIPEPMADAVVSSVPFSFGALKVQDSEPPFKPIVTMEKSEVDSGPKVVVLPPEEESRSMLKSVSPLALPIKKEFRLPPLKLLDYDAAPPVKIDEGMLRVQADRLEKTFDQFGIKGHVREIRPGPVVTLFEFVPAPGIKLTRIAALADDIAMAMVAMHVRIVAPMPGKGAVGIEIPNERREMVYLKEIVASPSFAREPHRLCMALGKTIEGKAFFVNLADMPHVLIAGTTGSGKSVSVNGMICSILYRATPDEVRFIMIDPKMLELSIYDGIPHLLMPPIIDSKKAANALKWAVREMEHRYQLLNERGVRDIDSYNQKSPDARIPYIVVVVDEYADLIAVAGKDVEGYVMRLAQKARASGIHVMLATQRPSVDIITGVIKANFPVRIGFRLASAYDSKTIINRSGAETLLGKGDMLLVPPGCSDLLRVHGAFVSEKELSRVVDFWKGQGQPNYDPTLVSATEETSEAQMLLVSDDNDDKYRDAVNVVMRTRKCSTSWLQRQLGVGYNRAARMVEQMEREGIVGPIQNAKGEREIFGAGDNSSAYPS